MAIAVDAANVYWTEASGNVMQAPLGGGTPFTLASGQPGPTGIAVQGGSVYWLDLGSASSSSDAAINTVPVGGGAIVTLAHQVAGCDIGAGGEPNVIAVDSTSVYYSASPSHGSSSASQVLSVPLGGGTPTVLASDPEALGISSIAIDATRVYYVTNNALIKSVPLTGGSPVTLTTTGSLSGFAVDATNAYGVLGGGISIEPLGGGMPSLVAMTSSDIIESIAADATQVYWTDWTRGQVGIAPK